ncbi:MAG: EF-P beta-lysylation protein EpmB [Gammaproteobacteria bacterium]|nr:EF-P beta-lysylation protein EpmB [Gammaproteobacteria bacterium]
MIPLSTGLCQAESFLKTPPRSWQRELAQAHRETGSLLAALGLSAADLPSGVAAAQDFPTRVPRGYVARMAYGDPADPLLLQVLPRGAETIRKPGFVRDPVGDGAALASPGLLHKYHGRVLLMATEVCPVHCRYCFRRHYPYTENRADDAHWSKAMDYIRGHEDIREVILSGGDPLSLSDERLSTLTDALRTIPHIKRLRIHSRMPIVLPERIDAGLLAWLRALPWHTVLVTHCNHANEIDPQVSNALAKLRNAGVFLLNQAVLLRDINDTVEAQEALSETLFEVGVLPYYLHLLDRVQGAAHFEVSEPEARRLLSGLQQRLPGFLTPKLVREIAGKSHKIPV